MIINTGARTDTVQYFSEWLIKRFEEGYVLVRNPMFPEKVTKYELTPDKVDCVIFCSKNYKPILKDLYKITSRFNTYFHYTITAYDKDIEPGVPSIDESIKTLYELEKQVSKNRIAWRYDPILYTGKYDFDYHCKTFNYMSEKLAKHIDRCIFSFVEIYKKLEYNMPELIKFDENDKMNLAKMLGDISKRCNINIQTCGTDIDYSKFGIDNSGCMTSDILGNANNIRFKKIKHSGSRVGCHCMPSRDIGAYDTCMNGCKYCYANKNPKLAFENYKHHDKNSPMLLSNVNENDIMQMGQQKSFLE